MPTETFTREEFEKFLTDRLQERGVKWEGIGVRFSEYCYLIPTYFSSPKLLIHSSIRASGVCDGAGENSIRVTIVDGSTSQLSPLAAKDTKSQRWVARTKNWRLNLLSVLRDQWRLARMLAPCPHCGGTPHINRVKNPTSSHHGRLFLCCDCRKTGKHFQLIDEVRRDGEVHYERGVNRKPMGSAAFLKPR